MIATAVVSYNYNATIIANVFIIDCTWKKQMKCIALLHIKLLVSKPV